MCLSADSPTSSPFANAVTTFMPTLIPTPMTKLISPIKNYSFMFCVKTEFKYL